MSSRTAISIFIASTVSAISTGVGIADDKADDKPRLNQQRIAELTDLIESKPDDVLGYRLRALEYASGEVWDKAAADFVKVAALNEGNSQIGQRIGVLLVLAKDTKTHKVLCEEMFNEYSQSNNAGDLERTAKLCALAQQPVGNLESLLELARRSVKLKRTGDFVTHHHRTLGLVLYRMQKYEEAIETIRKADQIDSAARVKIPNVVICNRAIEAMCLTRGGRLDEAKKVLAKATPVLEEHFKHPTVVYRDKWWHDWLIAKVLHNEAQELITKAKK